MKRLKLDGPPLPTLIEGDARVQALVAARSDPQRPEDYVTEINRLWNRAKDAFLDIGKLLIRAKDALPHGEYTLAVEAHLPFSARTAYQLREAARWAVEMDRTQTIPLARLPGSYSTIYLLSTLDHETLTAAEQDGLLRPELRRAELVAWRKAKSRPVSDRSALLARQERILRERARLDEELRRIREELGGHYIETE